MQRIEKSKHASHDWDAIVHSSGWSHAQRWCGVVTRANILLLRKCTPIMRMCCAVVHFAGCKLSQIVSLDTKELFQPDKMHDVTGNAILWLMAGLLMTTILPCRFLTALSGGGGNDAEDKKDAMTSCEQMTDKNKSKRRQRRMKHNVTQWPTGDFPLPWRLLAGPTTKAFPPQCLAPASDKCNKWHNTIAWGPGMLSNEMSCPLAHCQALRATVDAHPSPFSKRAHRPRWEKAFASLLSLNALLTETVSWSEH